MEQEAGHEGETGDCTYGRGERAAREISKVAGSGRKEKTFLQ